jgi:hypothetical protein
MPVCQFYTKHGVGQILFDRTLYFYCVLFRHWAARPVPPSIASRPKVLVYRNDTLTATLIPAPHPR